MESSRLSPELPSLLYPPDVSGGFWFKAETSVDVGRVRVHLSVRLIPAVI